MKMDMMIVGLKAITDEVMELELVPLTTVKQKISPLDLISKGAQNIIQELEKQKQHRSRFYVTREWCSKYSLVPFMGLEVEIKRADPKRMVDTYVK